MLRSSRRAGFPIGLLAGAARVTLAGFSVRDAETQNAGPSARQDQGPHRGPSGHSALLEGQPHREAGLSSKDQRLFQPPHQGAGRRQGQAVYRDAWGVRWCRQAIGGWSGTGVGEMVKARKKRTDLGKILMGEKMGLGPSV